MTYICNENVCAVFIADFLRPKTVLKLYLNSNTYLASSTVSWLSVMSTLLLQTTGHCNRPCTVAWETECTLV